MTKNNTKMQQGISFLKLIETNKILIPRIQRNYAQGRLDHKIAEIRDGFLTSIFDVFTTNDSGPLLLDFIYGSTHGSTHCSIFTPLDGQQRLTTLFLLHLYFMPQDIDSPLSEKKGNLSYSRFSYETRISSRDFCNMLVSRSIRELKKELDSIKVSLQKQINEIETDESLVENSNKILALSQLKNENKLANLSTTIKNQSWFLWSWHKDPTIKAMLVMLDEIDKRASNLDEAKHNEIWRQLEEGKILFHVLPLEQFGLSDELYLKMNARGKELSSFDILKSTLEEQMRLNNVKEEIQDKWRKNIDSNWIDIFWNKLAKPFLNDVTNSKDAVVYVNSVEDGYLRFLKRMMVFHLFMNDNCITIDFKDENIKQYIPFEFYEDNFINKIREFSVRNDILLLLPLLNKIKFFNEDFFKFVINFFTSFIYEVDNVKKDGAELIENISSESKEDSSSNKNIFDSFISTTINYDTRVQFFAILKFFEFNSAQGVNEKGELKTELNSWIRIIRNLSTNTNSYFYNGYDDFLKSLKSIELWSSSVYSTEGSNKIIDYIKEQPKLDGFNGEQLKEEKVKANLITINAWRESIVEAEEHPYFLGQIRFLLEWSKVDNEYDISLFNKYKTQCFSIFDEQGLKKELSDNNVFRNALMTLPKEYLFNNCFIQNSSKDRDFSWKRYLRESEKSNNIKLLIDLNQDESKSFIDFCIEQKSNLPEDWRRLFIDKPELYNELYYDKINWWNRDTEEVCLLSKTTWRCKHKELKTFYFYLKYWEEGDFYLDSTDETHPFSAIFNRGEKEFSVKFLRKWNDVGSVEGQYVVSSNFKPNLEQMEQNETNERWEIFIRSENLKHLDKFDEIESLIDRLNDQCKVQLERNIDVYRKV